ncbi:MAG: hypothetical protein OXH63_06315 [Gemmatimonadetes bacterium]|nr:hypothetical protein [Gemmatimonadota bacterium]
MSESTDPQTRAVPTPEEMPWSISYLRDDIKDLRTQVGALHGRIDETNRSLGDRIDETNRSLGEQIRALHKRMDTYFLWMMGTLVAITSVLIAVIKL